MKHWRLRQHFGYGAARLALCPGPAGGPARVTPSLADALAALAGEVRAHGVLGSARKCVTTLGTGLVAGVLVLLLVAMFSRDFQDPDLEIVRFEPAPAPDPLPPPVQPAIRAPEPVAPAPELAEAPPPPVPEPAPPPPEPPPVVTRTLPPPPKPVPAPAPPPPPERVVARVTPRRTPSPPPAAPRARPEVRIDAVAKTPSARAPAPSRARVAPPEPVASRTPPPALGLDPVAPEPFQLASPVRTAPAPRRAPPSHPKPALAPALAPPPIAAPDPGAVAPRSNRVLPSAAVRDDAPRRPPGGVPAFAAARVAEPPASAAPPRSGRSEPLRQPATGESRPPGPENEIRGVALGTLAACVSDREEDRLKLAVMAAAGNRSECTSRAGRYHLVETKNLNAFLMWIQRSKSSVPGDRCMELELALDCLRNTGRRGADRT